MTYLKWLTLAVFKIMQQRGWARHVVTINPLDNWSKFK